MIRLPFVLVFSTLLFSVGVYGVLARRNAVMVLMAIEMMLNAVNVNLIAFSSSRSCPSARRSSSSAPSSPGGSRS